MLKLERKSHDGQVNIQVRDKEHLFGRTLWIALACAVAYHALFFTLFRVTPLPIPAVNTVFPPISVESEAGLHQTGAAITSDETAPPTFYGIPFPDPSMPALPSHPHHLSARISVDHHWQAEDVAPFKQLEEGLVLPALAMPKRKAKHPVDLVVSGLLASRQVVDNGYQHEQLAAIAVLPSQNDVRAVYAVRVEGRSGKIFWYEAKETPSSQAVTALSESILRKMSFAADAAAFEIDGEIELHFHPETL